MTVPSAGATHSSPAMSGSEYPTIEANMSLSSTVGAASASMIQKSRRNIATWS
jgi:hypothetical protein